MKTFLENTRLNAKALKLQKMHVGDGLFCLCVLIFAWIGEIYFVVKGDCNGN